MSTQPLFLLGHPVGHSKSPVMYNAAYEALALDWHYECADIAAEEDARSFLAARDYLSVNITTPYKPLAFALADEHSAEAVLADGANLLLNRGGSLAAHNTDGLGCVGFLTGQGMCFAGAQVVICGSGPTALAILGASAAAGAAQLRLLGRNEAHARSVLAGWQARYEAYGLAGVQADIAATSYEKAHADLAAADLVVNATPLGMHAGDGTPFDPVLLHKGQLVFDAVYGHGETALCQAAEAAQCRFFDGAGMLVGQAIETLRILCDEYAGGFEACLERAQLSESALFDLMAQAAGFFATA